MSSESCASSRSRVCGLLLAVVLHVSNAEVMRSEVVQELSPSIRRRGLPEWTNHAHDVQCSVLAQELEGMVRRTTIQVCIDPIIENLNAMGLERGQVELRRMVRHFHAIVFLSTRTSNGKVCC